MGRMSQLFARRTGGTEAIEVLQQRLRALYDWQDWANGAHVGGRHIRQIAETFHITQRLDPTLRHPPHNHRDPP